MEFARPPRRIVSLVPSLTEALAATVPDRLVGATDWCTHPAGLDVARVRGTKNPDRAAVAALGPDLVVANQEENRRLDVERLRAAGIPVWVTVIESLDQALRSMRRLFADVLAVGEPDWLAAAAVEWDRPAPDPALRVVVPIWRDPWMVVGSRTFTGDLLARLGLVNAFGSSAERYPRVELGRAPVGRCRRRPAARRALRLHRRRRARGVPGHAVRARVGAGAHLVRPLPGHRPGRPDAPDPALKRPPGSTAPPWGPHRSVTDGATSLGRRPEEPAPSEEFLCARS